MTIFDKHIKTILRPCQCNKYCCVWGCSEVVTSADGSSERRVLAFDSNDQLKNHHILKCHKCYIVDDPTCTRPSVSDEFSVWDPAGGLGYIEWNPFNAIVCEVCHMDVDEHLVLICVNFFVIQND